MKYGRDNDKSITDMPDPEPAVAWYGNYKLWIGAAIVVVLGLLVYAAL